MLTNTLLIQAAGIHDVNTWNKVSWSISAEFIVYAGFALTLIAFRSRATLVLGLLAAISVVVLLDFSPYYMDTQHEFGVMRCVFGFATGHLVYQLYRHIAAAANGGPRFGSIVETKHRFHGNDLGSQAGEWDWMCCWIRRLREASRAPLVVS